VAWILLATPSQNDSEAFFWQLIVSRFMLGKSGNLYDVFLYKML